MDVEGKLGRITRCRPGTSAGPCKTSYIPKRLALLRQQAYIYLLAER
jgi:hypothetical protein